MKTLIFALLAFPFTVHAEEIIIDDSGVYYTGTGASAINPKNGELFIDAVSGYLNTDTGEFFKKYGGREYSEPVAVIYYDDTENNKNND